MKKARMTYLLVLLLACAMLMQGCGGKKETAGERETEKPSVTAGAEAKSSDAALDAHSDAPATATEEADQEDNLACPSKSGRLHVEGTKLSDSSGKPVQLRGISTHGLAWFPEYVNEACFSQLRQEWHANVIRLAMYTAESGGYCTDGDRQKLKELIRKGVSCAADADMYAIIDWHILSDGDPNTYLQEARSFFDEMSREYKDADNVLYEICNEPNGGVSWQQVKTYAKEIIGVIRANDPDSVIIVGTPNWCQDVDQAAADPLTGYDNLMYTLHFYAATHKEDLRGKMVAAVEAGLPVFVTEYGICDASGNGAIDQEQAQKWVETMNQYGISYAAWNLSNKAETSAILKSDCRKTEGFQRSDLSEGGLWVYEMLTGQKAAENGSSGTAEQDAAHTNLTDVQSAGSASGQLVFESGGMEITAVEKNSWEANGQSVYQYDLTLKNISGSACTQWAVDVPFSGAFTVTDSWNGVYTANDTVLHISSMDYNGAVEPEGTIKDVGFIVSGSAIATE